jgi:hypothetical protein
MASSTAEASTMHSTLIIASMALDLTGQDWTQLGHGGDPNVVSSTDLVVTVDRVLALFVVRIVALIAHRQSRKTGAYVYSDLSTTTICKTAADREIQWDDVISSELISELKAYIETILRQYNQVSYHNFEHAYHVIISANKLLDLMLHDDETSRHHQTFGLKSDPLSHLALLFSALVHDVEHQGVPNRQLVLESDNLALLYNDQSVAEQRSLAIAFAELRKECYHNLCNVLFDDVEDYRRFRKTVIDLVLATDIASPERTQVVKSKWKEAFGDKKNLSEKRVNMQILKSEGEVDPDDSSSETSTSITPESCEALEYIEVASRVTGSLSDDGMATRRRHNFLSSSETNASSVMANAAASPKGSILTPLPSHSTLKSRNRAVSSEDHLIGRGSRTRPSQAERGGTATRRFSMPTSAFDIKKAHVRLGIRRSLDLTGEMIETYIATPARTAKADSIPSASEGSVDDIADIASNSDDPDELKASVVLEQILKAADVSPNMQGWEQMEKWSGRLFFELVNSYAEGRGEDPRQGWFQNQITFMESYMLPLARRLQMMQVFGDEVGSMFGMRVEENRDRWLEQGMSVTQKWIVDSSASR